MLVIVTNLQLYSFVYEQDLSQNEKKCKEMSGDQKFDEQ